MNYGNAIKKLRRKKKIRQMEFARRVGITQPYLSQIEKGHKLPRIEVLQKMSDVLEFPLPFLFLYSGEWDDFKGIDKNALQFFRPLLDVIFEKITNDPNLKIWY